jgi:hypothetical protein
MSNHYSFLCRRDSSISSGSSSSIANAVIRQSNDHESTHNNQQNLSDPKSQKYIPPGGRSSSSTTSIQNMQHPCRPIEGTSLETSSNMSLVSQGSKGHLSEQLDSNNDKSEASSQLGNDTSNSKQTTSAENGTSDTSQQKPQYSNVVSQGQAVPSRRFTVLGRPTGQIGNGTSSSTKLALVKTEHSDRVTLPRSHLVSQNLEQLSQQASANVKSHHAGVEKKDGCPDIIEKLVPGNHKQLSESMASHRSTAVQCLSSRPVLSNLCTSDAKYEAAAGPNNLSDLKCKLASRNQLQLVNQQGAPISNTGIGRASLGHSTPNKQRSESTTSHRSTAVQFLSSRPVLSNLSTSGAKSEATAGPNNLSDLKRKLASRNQLQVVNNKDAPISNTGIGRASLSHSTPNKQLPSTVGKQQDSAQGGHGSFYNREMVRSGDIVPSHCSDSTTVSRPVSAVSSTDVSASDRKERKRQAYPPGFENPHHSSDSGKFVYVSSPSCSGLCSTSGALVQDSCGVTDQQDLPSWATDCLKDDADVTHNLNVNQRHAQFQGTFFPGWSNQPRSSPYRPHHKPEYWDGTTSSYMSTGGYDTFCQRATSGMGGGMAGTLLQQPTMPSPRGSWTDGNTDSGMNCPQVDIAYPMYTLF